MERKRLGRSDLAITPIGLGTWAIGGGDWVCGWGPQKNADSIATIRRAIQRGINWIDTAGAYGLGHAETVVARALRDTPPHARPFIFGNGGLAWDDLGNVRHDLRPASIRREAEESLRRLGIEAFDLYQLGWPTWPYSPVGHDPGPVEEAWDALGALQREGKVRYLGVSNCNVELLRDLSRTANITCVQGAYSLISRGIESTTLSFCRAHGIGTIAYSPLQWGLLTGCMSAERARHLPHNDWRRHSKCFQEPAISHALRIVDRLRAVGDRRSLSPATLAVAWTLRQGGVTAAIVGARRPSQVDDIVAAATIELFPRDMEELEVEAHV